MELIELIIDEKDPMHGIEAVSVVEYPAIEENFIAKTKRQNGSGKFTFLRIRYARLRIYSR
jgi:hypothetical protein